ncbi:MAG: NAD(P)/FAD-dependent oxidoreductase, partial [Cyclobacteriaceae bacterium]|nr:NAD(P)/FAD-dependent oxidoreductase [Cyclobacteriaceae bacterium]
YSDAKILGGSMIAPHAGEMSQELILALSANLGIKSLFNKIYPYPTGSRVNKTIILNKYLEALKPWIVKLLKLIY